MGIEYRADMQVPVPDSTDNVDTSDAVGNKLDSHDTLSVMGRLHSLDEHAHSESITYPTLADPIVVTGGAGVWELGAFVEIVPANTITEDFDIHNISVEAISANDNYELHLFEGETFMGCVRFVKNAGLNPTINVPVLTPRFAANAQVQAKLATKGGGADTVDISVFFHEY